MSTADVDTMSPTMAAKQKRTQEPELVTRAAPLTPSTLDEKARTVEVTWTTGARVMRGFFERYFEELSLDPKAVRMGRLQNGAPVLDSHNGYGLAGVIGVVESARLEKGRGTAVLRFDTGAAGDDAFRKVRDGIVRNVSVGYRIHKLEKVEDGDEEIPTYVARDWEPHEISMVPIGADAGAQVREENKMSKRAIDPTNDGVEDGGADLDTGAATERSRCEGIMRIGRVLKWAPDQIQRHIAAGKPLDTIRAAVFDELARQDEETAISGHLPIEELTGNGRSDNTVPLMAEALASRCGGPAPSDGARQYLRLSTVDFARHFLERSGVSTRMMSRGQIVERALQSTSDYPSLLTESGNRLLRKGYQAYTGGLQRACRQVDAPDFRPLQRLQIGELGTLLKVNEGGEFTRTSTVEAKEAYSIDTFGRIFGITRRALVNDDLGAFNDLSTKLGRAAAEFVAGQLVALLVSNPTLGVDSTAVFHANHGNLAASGTVISVASLGVALKSMRLQKGLTGTPIDVTPTFLVVPASLETVALQTIAAITPTQTSNVNPFSGKLDLIVEPRLDATSATAWYLAADPGVIDTIEYAYLDGVPGPELIMQQGFEVDGVEWKVRLDFGAGILDFRGLYKNPGA